MFGNALVRADCVREPEGAGVDMLRHVQTRADRGEAQNIDSIGGMRCPAVSITRVPGWARVGERARRVVETCVRQDVGLQQVSLRFGDCDFEGPSEAAILRVRSELIREFSLPELASLQPQWGTPSSISTALFAGLLQAARDPDADTSQHWLEVGVPLGVAVPIGTSGIFPPSTLDEAWR